jgi:predicted nucleotidyltransferase
MYLIGGYGYNSSWMKDTELEKLRAIAAETNRQNRLEKERIEKRIEKAREFLATLVAEFLRIDPDIKKIVLFGSLAEGTVSREGFDIDIAVSSEGYLKLAAWCLNQPFTIDCIDLESASSHIAERIDERGEVLYEAEA